MMAELRELTAHRYLLGFGFLMVFLSGHGQTFLISLYGGVLRESFDLSHAGFGGLYSLATLMSGVLVIGFGRGIDRFALPLVAGAVVLGAASGGLLLALATASWMLVPALLLLRLCGQGLMVNLAQTTVARGIKYKRGTAISLITMGFPLAEAVMPAAVVALMATLGWRGSWLLLVGLLLLIALPVVLLLLRAERQERAKRLDSPDSVPDEAMNGQPLAVDWRRSEVLRDRRFYQILPALLAPPIVITALFFHQVPIAEGKGWSLALISSAFTAYAITHIVGLLLTGPLIDRLGARRLLGVYLLPMLAALGVLGYAQSAAGAFVYLGLMGLCVGASGTLMGALWPELYGLRHLGGIRAMAHGAMVLGTAAGPVLTGLLFDLGLSVSGLALVMAMYLVIAILLVLPVARPI